MTNICLRKHMTINVNTHGNSLKCLATTEQGSQEGLFSYIVLSGQVP